MDGGALRRIVQSALRNRAPEIRLAGVVVGRRRRWSHCLGRRQDEDSAATGAAGRRGRSLRQLDDARDCGTAGASEDRSALVRVQLRDGVAGAAAHDDVALARPVQVAGVLRGEHHRSPSSGFCSCHLGGWRPPGGRRLGRGALLLNLHLLAPVECGRRPGVQGCQRRRFHRSNRSRSFLIGAAEEADFFGRLR